ncbi:MAG: DNA replication/repair protein RecF [Gammaproteobacteria bacterium]|nr:DNA replication/repair protein RecF [Gammaproteobacteria bacterium]
MIIEQLTIQHLRSIRQAELDLAPGINLFCGSNGAGKTSVLEAVHVLATGRSFRTIQLETLRQHGQAELILAARVKEGDTHHRIGLSKGAERLVLRLDAAPAKRLSEIARHLAVIALHADSDQLVQGGPSLRRRFLDWWLFHSRSDFFAEWMRYQRLLKQRNAALRTDPRQLPAWDEPLAHAGEVVAGFRREAAERLMGQLERRLVELGEFAGFSWSLHSGWSRGEPLLEVLRRSRSRDREQGFTSNGPHRAELRLQVMGREAKEVLSRGQQKTLATLMLLSLAESYRLERQTLPVILLDDLAAELDGQHREHLLHHLIRLGGQILLTALKGGELDPWLPSSTRRFAVRGGIVTVL